MAKRKKDFHKAEATRASAAGSAPRARKLAKTTPPADPGDALAQKVGSPEGVDFNAENELNLGTAPDARGKDQADENEEGGDDAPQE